MNKIQLALGMGLGALALTSCELSDNAQRSADNSGVAAASSRRAADNSDDLLELSNNGYADTRIGSTRDRRAKDIEGMERAVAFDTKAFYASSFLAAFEFQFIKPGMGKDTHELRMDRLADGVTEYIRTARNYLDPSLAPLSTVDTLMPPAGADAAKVTRDQNALALAVSLHRINPRQKDASVQYGFQAISMFDALAQGLIARSAVNSGDQPLSSQPKYVEEVLKEERAATYLLQARMNALLTMALRYVITPADLAGIIGRTQASWKPNFVSVSQADAQSVIDRMKLALQARDALVSAGIRPEIELKLAGLLMTMNAGEPVFREDESANGKAKLGEVIGLLRAAQQPVATLSVATSN